MHDQLNEKTTHEQHGTVRIHIDNKLYDAPKNAMTGLELRALADIPPDVDLWQIVPGQQDDILITDEALVQLEQGMHFTTAPKLIHYTVNDEPQTTQQHDMTAYAILDKASPVTGYSAAESYLKDITNLNDQKSYKDNPNQVIHLHDGMKFLAIYNGGTPVS